MSDGYYGPVTAGERATARRYVEAARRVLVKGPIPCATDWPEGWSYDSPLGLVLRHRPGSLRDNDRWQVVSRLALEALCERKKASDPGTRFGGLDVVHNWIMRQRRKRSAAIQVTTWCLADLSRGGFWAKYGRSYEEPVWMSEQRVRKLRAQDDDYPIDA